MTATALALMAFVGSTCNDYTTASTPYRPVSCGEVVVLKGINGYWPRLDKLCNKLLYCGYSTRVICSCHRSRLAAEICQRVRCGGRAPSCIIGYSLGATNAIILAEQLQRYGIAVPKLVLLDPLLRRPVPANVCCCVNLSKSHRVVNMMFPGSVIPCGTPLACCASTRMITYDLVSYKRLGLLHDNHFALGGQDAVHDLIVRCVTTECLQP